MRSAIPILFAAAIALASCASAGDRSSDAGALANADALVGCAGQGDAFTANLAKTGANGVYTFTLVSANPAPPSIDTNAWTLAIVDANGTPPALTDLTVTPFMPKMGHGSDQVPQISTNSDGTFAIADVYLLMNGLWTVTIDVKNSGFVIDSAVFTFCIDG